MWLLAEVWVAASPAHGRGCCRWSGLFVCSRLWLCSMAEDWVVVLAVAGVDGAEHLRVRACSRVWAGVLAVVWVVLVVAGGRLLRVHGCWWVAGRRLGRLGRLGWKLVDDFCGAGLGFLGVRGCGRGYWPSSRSSRCLRVVASRVGEARLGGVRLRSRLWVRLWVVGVTRKDV